MYIPLQTPFEKHFELKNMAEMGKGERVEEMKVFKENLEQMVGELFKQAERPKEEEEKQGDQIIEKGVKPTHTLRFSKEFFKVFISSFCLIFRYFLP